ncbi:MAG: hypothetical protein H7099_21215 [Gemmatimonadaceae bacterium]|nr:hypothetical protein [Gemmatimonadaceae bacterium]
MTISDDELRRAYADVDVPTDRAPTADEIRGLLDGDGDDATRLATLARLVSTPDGRRELDMLRALRDGFVGDDTAEHAPRTLTHDAKVDLEFPTRIARPLPKWIRPFGLAAALLIATLIGVERLVSRATTPVFRSGAVALALVAPADGARVSGALTFLWRGIAGATYELEVYSTDGREIVHTQTRDTVLLLPAGTSAGDYRWWVTARLEDGTQLRSATRRVVLR